MLLFISQRYYPSGADDFVAFVDTEEEAETIACNWHSANRGNLAYAKLVEIDTESKTYKVTKSLEIDYEGVAMQWDED